MFNVSLKGNALVRGRLEIPGCCYLFDLNMKVHLTFEAERVILGTSEEAPKSGFSQLKGTRRGIRLLGAVFSYCFLVVWAIKTLQFPI